MRGSARLAVKSARVDSLPVNALVNIYSHRPNH
jgi:hypothetical protein